MRILYVSASSEIGGAELTMLDWFRGLPGRGWPVAGVWAQGAGGFIEAARALDLVAASGSGKRFRDPRALAADVAAIRRLARETGAQAIHSAGAKGHLYGGSAARLAGLPAMWFFHDLPDRNRWVRLAAPIPAHAVGNSEATVAAVERLLGAGAALVRPGVDVDRMRFDARARAAFRAAHGIPPLAPLAAYVGRLQRSKGVHLFLEGLALARRRHPGLRGLVLGGVVGGIEAGFDAELRGLAAGLGLGDAVVFAPFAPDPADAFSAIDVLVHVPLSPEGFGRTVVEAMAAGRWVVTISRGGTWSTLGEGCGELLDRPDGPAVGAALERFLADPGLAASAAERGPARARRFDLDASCDQLAAAYRAAFGGGGTGR